MTINGTGTKPANGEGVVAEQPGQRKDRRSLLLFLLLPLLLGGICLWSLFANVTLSSAETFIPAGLHSSELADYSPDEQQSPIRGLHISIIESVIQDRDPEALDAEQRATELVKKLDTPIPTVTPRPGLPTRTPQPIATRTPAPPPATSGPTDTPGVSPTPSLTRTPSRTPTATTPAPGPTATKTKTPTPSNTPTFGPSPTNTPCKVAPVLEINTPLDVPTPSTFDWMDVLPGEAKAYDPDNVDPLNCQPIGDFVTNNGDGITQVQFKIVYVDGGGVTVHEQNQFTELYCAFTGTPTCLTQSLGPPFEWPNDTPIGSGEHELHARARDDEGVWSEWEHVHFFLDVAPTPTPSPTPTDTPTAVPCTVYGLSGFGSSLNDVYWTLGNGGPVSAEIQWITVEWGVSGDLTRIKLDGTDIWDNGASSSPATVTGPWIASRTVGPSQSKELRFTFQNPVAGGMFSITVHLDVGCDLDNTGTAS